MNNFLSQLNLTAQERRIVAGIFLVVIVVLNYLFVWPHFGDWSSINKQLDKMRKDIENQGVMIKQDWDPARPTNGWKFQVEQLAKREGGSMMEHPVNPQVQLQTTIRAQERKTGIFGESMNPGTVKTNNEFFEEQSAAISLECEEPQLVSFLYNMGMDPAMIRVSVLNLKPADANRYRLKASLTLTANYAKKPPANVSEPAADKHAGAKAKTAPAPGAKPPAAPGPKHLPSGPIAPGAKKPPLAGRRLSMPARPAPGPKPSPGQKALE